MLTVSCFLVEHLESIGLVLDIIGIWLLFCVGSRRARRIQTWAGEEVNAQKKRESKFDWAGVWFMTIGFILQILSNYW